ncbi:MAG TPA: NAD-dependent epimerase/dehydratase family protein [Gaiellaceae bacterium]|nr:NAD-dependent epimerase/dehydratase family protein [Gaiellaceae bacterium]
MRILVLGGTQFLGRALVETALARGDEVTLFNRGRTRPELFPGVRRLVGDRDGGLDALREGAWDAVVDTSGYVPRVVRESAELLAGRAARYLFVSSISAYADLSRAGADESAPVAQLQEETEDHRSEAYGALKALCEQTVEAVWGERATVVRPGLIVGPWDPTGRFTYWPVRIAAGGDVLAPEPREAPVQVIDVRDLAAFCLRLLDTDTAGVFNATGPERPLTMEQVLEECRAVSGTDARLVWVHSEWLVSRGVGEWMELPLWLSDPDYAGMMAVDVSRALAAGLAFRPLAETIADTLAWVRAGDAPADPPAGLDRDRERTLLDSLPAS